jgi:uncharacterized protein (DUF58 family)
MKFELITTATSGRKQARKVARQNLRQKVGRGQPLTIDDLAQARGLVVRERENSIFSDAWIPLSVLFIVIAILAGRYTPLLALGSSLLLIVAISVWWKNRALDGVHYQRTFDRTHVFPGEPVTVTIQVVNDKFLPLTWLQFRDRVPTAPDEEGALGKVVSETLNRFSLQNSFSLQGYEQAERHFTYQFDRRGFYRMGPVTAQSGDIFTLFTIEHQLDYIDTVVVFPQIWPLAELGFPAKEPFGELKISRSLFTDPIKTQGIRDYQPEDRFRDVHWKATARRGNLQTKVYEPSSGMTIAIFLNVATSPRHWMGFSPELLERAISVAGSIASYGVEQKWGVGLFVNGTTPGSDQSIRVLPSQSPQQLMLVLEALAAAKEFATGAVEKLMRRESPGLPWGATLILVTAVVTDEMATMLLRLKRAGRRVVLVTLAEAPPPANLHGVTTYHIPQDSAAFAKLRRSSATEATLGAIPVPAPVLSANDKGDGRPTSNDPDSSSLIRRSSSSSAADARPTGNRWP